LSANACEGVGDGLLGLLDDDDGDDDDDDGALAFEICPKSDLAY
jgi:hypothetical protein